MYTEFFFWSYLMKELPQNFRYRIQQGSFDDFSIDSTNGNITVTKKLDYDRRNTYKIEVVASDMGKTDF